MNIKNFFLRSVLSSIDHMPNYEITIVLISFLSPLMVSNSPLVGCVWCTTSKQSWLDAFSDLERTSGNHVI